MSTTIKRIALVAVAALSLGVVSVAPSQATNSVLTFGTGDAAGATTDLGYAVAGAFNYATVNVTSAAADYVLTTDSTFVGQGDASPAGVLSTDAKSLSMTDTSVTGVRVATPAVGTVTVKYWVRTNGVLATTAAESVVITVNATAQSGSYSAAKSTVYIASGETSTAVTADATIAKVSTVDTNTAAGTIQVSLADALGNAYNDTVTAIIISGPGTINGSDTATISGAAWNQVDNQYSKAIKTSGGKAYFGVYANGQSGTTKVSLRLTDGTVIAEKSLAFSSTTAASITAVVKKAFVLATTSSATTKVFAVTLKDASGNAIANSGTVTATPATGTTVGGASACTWDATDSVYYCDALGLAADKFGVVEYTFSHSSASATSVNAKASVTFSANVASTLTIVAGATSAEPGSKITYTLTAKDANGYALPDAAYAPGAFVASATSSASLVGTTPFAATETVTLVNGVATASTYAPFGGSLTIAYTLAGTAGTASTNLASTLTASTANAPVVTITNAAIDGATDAANEAAQAASDATDAALAAADAADIATAKSQEALDAVNDLAATVATLIADLKSQIKTLSNLVTKIAKKVKA